MIQSMQSPNPCRSQPNVQSGCNSPLPTSAVHTVILMQDLFKQWVIMQAWAGKQDTCGGSRLRPSDNLDAGLVALAAIARKMSSAALCC